MALEKARCKKLVSQKNGQIRNMESELDELRTDSRSLEIRVRALNNELQTYKRGRPGRYKTHNIPSSRESSRDRNVRQASSDSRASRKTRPPVYRQSTASSRYAIRPLLLKYQFVTHTPFRLSQRSRSRDPSPAGSIRSRGSAVSSIGSSIGSHKSTTSKKSTSQKRFDPTAYIKAKKEKEKDAHRRTKRVRPPPKSSTNYHSRESSYNSAKFSRYVYIYILFLLSLYL